jgi:hypothetical protein
VRRSLAFTLSAGAVIGAALAPAAASAASATPGSETAFRGPAPAAGDPPTTVTFTVTSGSLAMTAPTSANLGSGTPGTTISGALGAVTVTDSRALLAASWIVSASSSSFTTGGGTAPETIPATAATYRPGTVTTTGTITATPNAIVISLTSSPQAVVTGTAGVGSNTASWNPIFGVAVPSGAVGGAYTGTLTQSVA